MSDPFDLQRFIKAQQGTFEMAFSEIEAGSKQSHWMWFIFPQIAGLGHSQMAAFYAIRSIDEAQAYLEHPLLGPRLRQCIRALLPWFAVRSAEQIFGELDALKLRSSLTLFDEAEPGGIFAEALAGFFAGQRDRSTLALLNGNG